ncbi:hypothetical protein HUE56_30020 (plasmid) [Azospirillum oryzae]|uniref:Recombinase family protein n=2 Tax=Azospirillum TaxID=191 RepID=A0A6N1ATP1_9PROT|nr:hypothetical protein [Azospirillum sp. TSA2s]KAA0584267.1 hypothetical protein FZ938_30240 [Azospirillum oryzae]QCG99279.1 hypothetical protein E6C67_36440 [Azospirillum sp. TSA2s]QKS54739.1 hypothetical protein HUE56_30020 [Azospirillum oryzae]
MEAARGRDRGYIRQGRGLPSVGDQLAALKAAGVLERYVYIDRMPAGGRQATRRRPSDLVEREAVLADLRSGVRLVVASLSVIGRSEQDIGATVWQVLAAGASVYARERDLTIDVETGREIVKAEIAAAAKALMRSRPDEARKVLSKLVEGGAVKVGRRPAVQALPPEKQEAARQDWLTNRALSREQVAEKYGVSAGALKNAFGNRLMPRRRRERSTK